MKTLFALSLLGQATAEAAKDSAVNKVIQLIDELKGKVQSDLDAEAALMEEYVTWCDDEKTKTSYAIKDEKRIIEEQQAIVEDSAAKIEQYSSEISSLGAHISAKETEKAEAEDLRAKTNADFLAKEKELVEAEDMLRRAHGILKRHLTSGLSFAQGGAQKMEDVVKALGAIVDAAWIDPSKAQKLKAFLATGGDEEELELKSPAAPQATTSNYESKSGGILATIDGMRDEVMEDLRKARTAETNSKHSFELLAQSLDNEINSTKAALAAAKGSLADAQAANGAASSQLKSVQDTLATDQAYLATVTNDCAVKADEWAARQKAAADEMAVLQQASEVLASKVSVLAQTQITTRRTHGKNFDRRQRVVDILKKLGRKYKSFGLLQASTSAQADPFAKVRGMIEQMIQKLEEQAREEADQEEMCKTELAKNNKLKEKKIAELAKYNTRLDGAQAKIAQLTDAIETLKTELKDLAAAVKEATAMRNKENADNTKTIKDNRDSAAAVAEAIKILRDFYEPESFAQVAPPSFQAAKSDATHSIIGILETAESDFTKLFMDTEASEASASKAYKQFMQESEVVKAKKEVSVQGKQSEIESLGVQVNQLKDDVASTDKELQAVVDTLASLQSQCENKAMSYEERKSRREAEIAGLQEALEILSPEEGEALIQKAAFLARRKEDPPAEGPCGTETCGPDGTEPCPPCVEGGDHDHEEPCSPPDAEPIMGCGEEGDKECPPCVAEFLATSKEDPPAGSPPPPPESKEEPPAGSPPPEGDAPVTP